MLAPERSKDAEEVLNVKGWGLLELTRLMTCCELSPVARKRPLSHLSSIWDRFAPMTNRTSCKVFRTRSKFGGGEGHAEQLLCCPCTKVPHELLGTEPGS